MSDKRSQTTDEPFGGARTLVTLPMPDQHIGTGLKYHPTMHEVTLRYKSAVHAIVAMRILAGLSDE